MPRYPEVQGEPDMDIKVGPCGRENDSRTTDASRITTFEAGSTITVEWRETIPHSGWFRIAFDDDGQDDFPASPTSGGPPSSTSATYPILKDGIVSGGSRNMPYSTEITLPSTPCDNCTLQLIQVMTDRPGNPPYFTCADIILTAPAGTGGAGGAAAGGASGASGGGTAGSAGGVSGASGGGAGGVSGNAGAGGTGSGGMSGAAGAGGVVSGAGSGGAGSGGVPTNGGAGTSTGGAPSTAGTSTAGTSPSGSSGTSTSGGTTATSAGTPGQPAASPEPAEEGGCSVAGGGRPAPALALLGMGALLGLRLRRRSRAVRR